MKNDVLNTLSSQLKVNPYKVPEGYFEQVKAEISRSTAAEEGVSLWRKAVPYISVAATFLSTSMWLGGATAISDIAMEYRYDSAYQLNATNTAPSTYMPGFTFYANGFDFTIGSGVTTVSKDYSGSAPVDGDRFPNIFGGNRNVPEIEANPVVTVKSGTWSLVAAAGHSVSAIKDSSIAGNVVINIAGGKIENLNGAGVSPFLNRQFATIFGDVTLRITGGEVEFITCVTGGGIEGKLLIDIDGGKVGDIFYRETRNFCRACCTFCAGAAST